MSNTPALLLGDFLAKSTKSDRIVIYNAAKQVIYRGYAANAVNAGINNLRKVRSFGIGMETYKATEKMWDWGKTDRLPEQIPVEQFSEYAVGQLNHILYIKIELENEFER